MGGASVQIAFVPGGDVTEHLFPVNVINRRYLMYAHSYLGYGQSSVVDHIKMQLEADNQASDIIHHPCMLRGAQMFNLYSHNMNNLRNSGDCVRR